MSSLGLGMKSSLQDKIYAQALNARDEGILTGVTLLSRMTVDWEDLGWSAVKSGVNTVLTTTKPKMGTIGKGQPTINSSNEYLQNIPLEMAYSQVSDFLKRLVEKIVDRIGQSPWFIRVKHILGIGFDVLSTVVTNMITSIPIIDKIIPFWSQIKGAVQSIDSAIKAYETKGDLQQLEGDKHLIGEGVPSIALDGFIKYVRREMALWAGKSAYQFGKSLAGVLGTIFAAPAMTVANIVSAVVEAVYSFISSLYQAFCFNNACKKCHDALMLGNYIDEFGPNFNSIVAACPLIGAFFFGLKGRIGGINLTCMVQDFHRVVSDSSLQMAMATKVCEANVLACKYIVGLNFKPKARNGNFAEDVKDALEMIEATAASNQVQAELKESKARKLWNKLVSLLN